MAAGFRRKWTNLTWSKSSWPDRTYSARSGARSFIVDHTGTGWRLRGWIDNRFCLYKHAGTARELQQIADDIAGTAS